MPKHKPIIFLDFDGVLNKDGNYEIEEMFEPILCERLSNLIKSTNSSIVLSTSHRYSPDVLKEFKKVCQKYNIDGRIIGRTKDLSGGTTVKRVARAREIQKWLRDHKGTFSNWVILDDMDMRIQNFVKTQSNVGLTPELVSIATSILLA